MWPYAAWSTSKCGLRDQISLCPQWVFGTSLPTKSCPVVTRSPTMHVTARYEQGLRWLDIYIYVHGLWFIKSYGTQDGILILPVLYILCFPVPTLIVDDSCDFCCQRYLLGDAYLNYVTDPEDSLNAAVVGRSYILNFNNFALNQSSLLVNLFYKNSWLVKIHSISFNCMA